MAGKPNQPKSLSAADVSQETNAQKEASQQKDSASASSDAVNKAKTTPVKGAKQEVQETKQQDGLPQSTRFPDQEGLEKMEAENKASLESKIDSTSKKDSDSSTGTSSGSSSPNPFTLPGANSGAMADRGGIAIQKINSDNNINSFNDSAQQTWQEQPNVSPPVDTPTVIETSNTSPTNLELIPE